MTMELIKDVLEVAYYIAFIYLTWRIVQYSKGSYLAQTEKRHQVLCKVCIMGDKEKNLTKYGVEVYNLGNEIAKNVTISVGEKISFKCDYIKPNESIVYPVDVILHMPDGNRVFFGDGDEELDINAPFPVKISVDGKQETFNLSTDILFASIGGDGLSEISRSIDRVASVIRNK